MSIVIEKQKHIYIRKKQVKQKKNPKKKMFQSILKRKERTFKNDSLVTPKIMIIEDFLNGLCQFSGKNGKPV